jgi:hypothetical protein
LLLLLQDGSEESLSAPIAVFLVSVRTLEALEVRYTTEPEAISPAVVPPKITTLYTATVVCNGGSRRRRRRKGEDMNDDYDKKLNMSSSETSNNID